MHLSPIYFNGMVADPMIPSAGDYVFLADPAELAEHLEHLDEDFFWDEGGWIIQF